MTRRGRWRGSCGRRAGLSIEALESRTFLDAAAGGDDRAHTAFLLSAAARTSGVRQPAALAVPSARAAAVPRPAALPLLPARITGPGQIVARGDNAVFTVTLTRAPGINRTVSVQFATVNGSATAGVHFTAQSGTLTFTGSETVKTIAVATNPAATASRFPKPDMFSVKLSQPVGVKLTSSSATATLEGVRQGVSVSPAAIAVVEGNSGMTAAVFNVTLVRTNPGIVTVNYATVDGGNIDGATAASGDYQAQTGTLTFAPGETAKQVTVNVMGDTQTEGQERFSLQLSSPVNAPLGIKSAKAYIINDDTTSGPVGQVNIEMVTIDGDLGRGDIGNSNLGVVARPYMIGKYEVTSGQYATFLNTVAVASDPHFLWNDGQNISRLGAPGAYVYSPIGSPNLPIYAVSWFNAARFANWMHNGQGSGSTGTGVYEFLDGRALTVAPSGATYTFVNDGAVPLKVGDVLYVSSERRPNPHTGYARVTAVGAGTFEVIILPGNDLEDGFRTPGQFGWRYTTWSDVRNPNAKFWLPNRNEWYRAAYYDPETRGLTRRYWDTAVRSSEVRGALTGNGLHHANEYGGWNGLRSEAVNVLGVSAQLFYAFSSGPSARSLLFSQYGAQPFGDPDGDFRDTNVTQSPVSHEMVTPVGAYTGSASYYGTFDQTGNVSELLESLTNGGFAWQAVGNSAVNHSSSQWDVATPAVPQLVPKPPSLSPELWVNNSWHGRSTAFSFSVRYQGPFGFINLVEYELPRWIDRYDLVGFRLAAAIGTSSGGSTNINVSVVGGSQVEGAVSGPLAAAVAFTISLDRASSQPVFVFFATANGTATAGNDYVARAGVLVFEPGVVRQTVRVSLVGNAVKELQETFSLKLSNPINAKLAIDTAIGTILDDD